eukprot:SAG11_NODE_13495_length_653_cov_0.694946_1_plen_76_part_10
MFHPSQRPLGPTAEVWAAPSIIPTNGVGAGEGGAMQVWWTVLAVDLPEPFTLAQPDLSSPDQQLASLGGERLALLA